MMVVLWLNSSIIIDFLNDARQEDLIEIKIFSSPTISLTKRTINYTINKNTLIVIDKFHNEQFLLNLNSIKSIRIVAPKNQGMSWFNGEIGAKAGETQS